MNNLQDVLETIKKSGSYAVMVMYGADIGADDSDVKQLDREVKIWWHPVGCIGESKAMLKGTLNEILSWDVGNMFFKAVSNPPKDKETEKSGLYIWGTDRTMKDVKKVKLKNWLKNR